MNIFQRIQNILVSPASEWQAIAGEPNNAVLLMTAFAFPLIAIGSVATFLGWSLRGAVLGGLELAIVGFVLGVAFTIAVGVVASKIAPQFGGREDMGAALKLAVYAQVPGWLGGIFNLLPSIAMVGMIFALYDIYLIYTGATPMLGVTGDKRMPFTAILTGAIIVILLFMVVISGIIVRA
ncbi:MAG TPA: Yip1 family protein [Stellaceae bacterium]|nr:Yip1 family protein [Stellaceae bacterium]